MKYFLAPASAVAPRDSQPSAVLIHNNWNDWYKYTTLYKLVVRIGNEEAELGYTKIGQAGMSPQKSTPDIPPIFEQLPDSFFSLGQDENYYEVAAQLRESYGLNVLADLRDCALDLSILRRFSGEDVMVESLMREVSRSKVEGRFHRLANGDAKLTSFSFAHLQSGVPMFANTKEFSGEDGTLFFKVEADSRPPTNVHVLIGRNGVGKTTRLTAIIHALLGLQMPDGRLPGNVGFYEEDFLGEFTKKSDPDFANLISVSFSAFDPFIPPTSQQLASTKLRYSYVGLKRPLEEKRPTRPLDQTVGGSVSETYTREELALQFARSALACRSGPRQDRWAATLATLEGDPLFAEAAVKSLLELSTLTEQHWIDRAMAMFSDLSSGHGIVLLTMTRLVELVDERTLVLLDEPEGHLHPPLLSAMIRSLSDLLIKRNGVAIVATHSPVVLQEAPSSCVWYLSRSGEDVWATPPERETFGENVGVLTRDVFGLEVSQSGFHKMIVDEVRKTHGDYDAVVHAFNDQLGDEARTLARGLSVQYRSKYAGEVQ